MSTLVEPHGGSLVDRFVASSQIQEIQSRAAKLPRLTLDAREIADLELLATGAVSPLTGFLGSKDYRSVLEHMRLANGTVWPLHLTLAVTPETKATLKIGEDAALYDEKGRLWGLIRVSEIFERNPLEEAKWVYRTDSAEHPGVAYLQARPTWLVAGE